MIRIAAPVTSGGTVACSGRIEIRHKAAARDWQKENVVFGRSELPGYRAPRESVARAQEP